MEEKAQNMEEQAIEDIYLSRENYKEYVNLDVVAFSYAHGGAQGVGGEIIVITRDAKMYSMNPVFGDIKIEMCDEVCPPLKDCIFGLWDVEKTPDGWKGVRLGAGNFLVLAEPLYHQLKRRMFKMPPHILYGEWIGMVINYLRKL